MTSVQLLDMKAAKSSKNTGRKHLHKLDEYQVSIQPM